MSMDLEQNDLLGPLGFAASPRSGFPGATINPDSFQCARRDGANAILPGHGVVG
jgi:hypothetical protein